MAEGSPALFPATLSSSQCTQTNFFHRSPSFSAQYRLGLEMKQHHAANEAAVYMMTVICFKSGKCVPIGNSHSSISFLIWISLKSPRHFALLWRHEGVTLAPTVTEQLPFSFHLVILGMVILTQARKRLTQKSSYLGMHRWVCRGKPS